MTLHSFPNLKKAHDEQGKEGSRLSVNRFIKRLVIVSFFTKYIVIFDFAGRCDFVLLNERNITTIQASMSVVILWIVQV